MKKVAILQSSYLPWKGYFDIIHDVDIFIFYDCVQFTNRDWRTRNYVKTKEKRQLISVPVHGSTKLKINQIKIANEQPWKRKHYKAFKINYSKCEYYKNFSYLLEEIYVNKDWEYISELNQYSTKEISSLLKINTKFIDSSELDLSGSKTDRLIDALKKVKANLYISGPSAKEYIEEEKFKKENIKLEYKDYSGYPEYNQMGNNFNHEVTVLDLLFNEGEKAADYIWGWSDKKLE